MKARGNTKAESILIPRSLLRGGSLKKLYYTRPVELFILQTTCGDLASFFGFKMVKLRISRISCHVVRELTGDGVQTIASQPHVYAVDWSPR